MSLANPLSKITDISRKPVVVLSIVFVVVTAIYYSGAYWAGFISDDYSLISKAKDTPIGRPLEPHHYELLRTCLVKLTADGYLSIQGIHALALSVHVANSVLVFFLSGILLQESVFLRYAATALFALNPVGYAAIAWMSAIGYVMVLTPILCGVLLILSGPRFTTGGMAFALTALQLIAVLIWDWGALFSPLMLICALLIPSSTIGYHPSFFSRKRQFLLLAPPFFMLLALLLFKFTQGYQIGYHMGPESLVLLGKFYLASPAITLFPNVTTDMVTSGIGKVAALLLIIALGYGCVKHQGARLSFALYSACLVPFLLFSVPESRYYYVASPFFYIAIACCIELIKISSLKYLVTASLIIISVHFSVERSKLWRDSYRESQKLKTFFQELPGGKPPVIVNLPDSYGPEKLLFKPYMWRNGTEAFGRDFVRINSPGVSFVLYNDEIAVLPLAEIKKKYLDSDIYLVHWPKEGSWRQFVVSKL